MPDEIDIEVCCDALLEALENGALRAVEIRAGVYCEAIPDYSGESGVAINFCPFCGVPRPHLNELQQDAESER